MVTGDGRTTYPLIFIYYCPPTSSPEMMMLYASSQHQFQNELNLGKAYVLHESEEFTKEWLEERLGKFGN
ncbi:Glia maturation factor beta [Smittium mucronatum]|uniref:Glia maturation factor beta n=1 Tax=Smittium mucronatum TaxID=133383 RepID=A0A1R0GNK9_9FUNG|nr:Glia maturation factor beta [Smittium mucronatum]